MSNQDPNKQTSELERAAGHVNGIMGAFGCAILLSVVLTPIFLCAMCVFNPDFP